MKTTLLLLCCISIAGCAAGGGGTLPATQHSQMQAVHRNTSSGSPTIYLFQGQPDGASP